MRLKKLLWVLPALYACAAPAAPMGFLTGPKTGTYLAMGRDVQRVAKEKSIALEVKESGGSVDNIRRLNSKENAGLAIVQSDVLNFLGRSQNEELRGMAGTLGVVMPLHAEEVHVLARKSIKEFSDLDGKRIVVGEEGGGSLLTSVNLLSMLKIAPTQTLKLSPPQGVLALLEGKADAVIFVSGKPVKLFQNLDSLRTADAARYESFLNDLHFIPLKDPRMLEEYAPAELTPQDYPFMEASVPTLSVRALLVAHDFSSAKGDKCATVYRLRRAIEDNLPELQKTGHPKWRDVHLGAKTQGWKQDQCAHTAPPPPKKAAKPVKKAKKPVKKSKPLPPDMKRIVNQR